MGFSYFGISRVQGYRNRQSNISFADAKALEEISELVGDQWKDTDVIDFINKTRSEGI